MYQSQNYFSIIGPQAAQVAEGTADAGGVGPPGGLRDAHERQPLQHAAQGPPRERPRVLAHRVPGLDGRQGGDAQQGHLRLHDHQVGSDFHELEITNLLLVTLLMIYYKGWPIRDE